MSDNFRYRYGDTCPVQAPFDTAVAIAIGDLCYIDSSTGKVEPASNFTWTSDLATTQPLFAARFVGVAGQRYDGTNSTAYGIKDGNLRVDTDGVYEFDCAAATFKVGDLVGPAKQSGNALENQKVAAVAGKTLAIGRVVEAGTSVTTVKVRISSAMAQVGYL